MTTYYGRQPKIKKNIDGRQPLMGVEFKVKDELGNSNGQRNIKVCISCGKL